MGFTEVVAKKAEVATQEDIAEIAPYDRNDRTMTFSAMALVADEVLGNALTKGDDLEKLEGVPFLITHVTFRRSFRSTQNRDLWLAYVSCEAIVADEAYLAQLGKSLDGLPFRPGEHIVFNDGSTGIYRQVVKYLASKEYVTIPEGPEEGGKEACRYDAPPSEWPDIRYGQNSFELEGFMNYTAEIRLLCPRGLRKSDYSNDFTDDGTTHYIA
jgi:hypothetical protein